MVIWVMPMSRLIDNFETYLNVLLHKARATIFARLIVLSFYFISSSIQPGYQHVTSRHSGRLQRVSEVYHQTERELHVVLILL